MGDKQRTMDEIVDSVPYVWTVVLELLERGALKPGHPARVSFYEKAKEASADWVGFAALALAQYPASLLEYGTSIGWAWLTPDGERLLAWLREHGTDDSKWPEIEPDDAAGAITPDTPRKP